MSYVEKQIGYTVEFWHNGEHRAIWDFGRNAESTGNTKQLYTLDLEKALSVAQVKHITGAIGTEVIISKYQLVFKVDDENEQYLDEAIFLGSWGFSK